MKALDVCGTCGYQFDVREGRIDFPHPLYPTFVCATCIKEGK
jgi:hypothetical protein